MGLGVTFIAISLLLFGQVFGDVNDDFDDNNYFENGFNDDGLFIDSNDDFNDFDNLDDNYFENGFDDDGLFDSDDSNVVRGGILGGSRAVSRPTGGSGSFTRMDYIPRQRHQRLPGRISAGVLGGGFNPISTRPMVQPRRLPKILPMRMPKLMPKMMPKIMPRIMPRQRPMIMPRIGAGIGGMGRFPSIPNFGKYGGIGRMPSFRRRRISAGIGGMQSRGFGKYFQHKIMGRGRFPGFSHKKIMKMY